MTNIYDWESQGDFSHETVYPDAELADIHAGDKQSYFDGLKGLAASSLLSIGCGIGSVMANTYEESGRTLHSQYMPASVNNAVTENADVFLGTSAASFAFIAAWNGLEMYRNRKALI